MFEFYKDTRLHEEIATAAATISFLSGGVYATMERYILLSVSTILFILSITEFMIENSQGLMRIILHTTVCVNFCLTIILLISL